MTYYKDLTPYKYFVKREPADIPVLNVGWLSVDQSYEVEITSQEFRNKLVLFCLPKNIVLLARGFHVCEFCPSRDMKENLNQSRELRSNGEIRVQVQSSILYAAPALIYHYAGGGDAYVADYFNTDYFIT